MCADSSSKLEAPVDHGGRFLFHPHWPVMPTMLTDLDIYRSAKILVEQHGADALIEAALKADELLDAGDRDGRAVWLRIRAAVVDLLRDSPLAHHRVNWRADRYSDR